MRGGVLQTIFVNDCHTPLPLSRGELIKSKQILLYAQDDKRCKIIP